MDPRIVELRSLLKSARRRPKSTDNLFFTKAACLRALGKHPDGTMNWNLPKLPVTRAYLEQWWEAVPNKMCKWKPLEREIRAALKWRFLWKKGVIATQRQMKMSDYKWKILWATALEQYDRFRDILPLPKDEALADIKERHRKRLVLNMRRRKKSEAKQAD